MEIVDRDSQPLADFFFDDHVDAPARYLFHYTSADATASIIDSKTLRFGALSRMNDPRENRAWTYQARYTTDTNGRSTIVTKSLSQVEAASVDGVVRGSARVFSSTYENDETADDALFMRGFARARNWAQYAADHRGACLVFDRESLESAARRTAEGLGPSIRVFSSPMQYEDSQAVVSDGQSLVFRGPFSLDPGWEESVLDWATEHQSALYFRKNTDWASEREYRIVALGVSAEAIFEVEIADSLVGIVLGSEFPNSHESVLEYRLTNSSLPYVTVARMTYSNGAPDTTQGQNGLEARHQSNSQEVRAVFGTRAVPGA